MSPLQRFSNRCVQTNGRAVVYLDSSALVKLVGYEAESAALERFLRSDQRIMSSELALVEVVRAVRPNGVEEVRRAERLLRVIDLIPIEPDLLRIAAQIDPLTLRSLDAVHLASAETLG